MNPVKTVSLVYGYSARNAGDFAITLGAIDVLLSFGIKVKLFSRYSRSNLDYHQALETLNQRYSNHIEVFESPFTLDRTDSMIKTLKNYTEGLFTIMGIIRKRGFRRQLLDSDMIIFNGGNLFRCNSIIDFTRLLALMYPLQVAQKNGKKVIIFPQSASTLNKIGKLLLFPILRKAQVVIFREKLSYKNLEHFMPAGNFFQTIDLAFFINKQKAKSILSINCDKPNIAITLRFHTVGDITHLPDSEIAYCLDELGKVVDKLGVTHNVIVVVQTEKDYETSQAFAIKHGVKLIKSHNVLELIEVYRNVDLLLGMRLHSIILALSVGTPCLGLFYKQWGLKNPGMMSCFNMPYKFWEDRPTAEDIEQNVQTLIQNKQIHTNTILEIVKKEEHMLKSKISEIVQIPYGGGGKISYINGRSAA